MYQNLSINIQLNFILYVCGLFKPDPGYSLCWDNVQIESTARHQSSERTNKVILCANAYAVKNRVSFRNLDGFTNTIKAKDIPLYAFLPNQDDYDALRIRMETLVARILTKHVGCFKKYAHLVNHHVEHEYSHESRMKSETVMLITVCD